MFFDRVEIAEPALQRRRTSITVGVAAGVRGGGDGLAWRGGRGRFGMRSLSTCDEGVLEARRDGLQLRMPAPGSRRSQLPAARRPSITSRTWSPWITASSHARPAAQAFLQLRAG